MGGKFIRELVEFIDEIFLFMFFNFYKVDLKEIEGYFWFLELFKKFLLEIER